MSLSGLNYSNFASFANTTCSNTTTIDWRNVTTLDIDLLRASGITLASYRGYPTQQLLDYRHIVLFCLVLFGLITNSSFLLTVVKVDSLHTTTYILLSSLACSDLIILTTILSNIWISTSSSLSASVVNICVHVYCFLLSTGFVLLVSIERYLAICHPLTHHQLKGNKRTIKLIGIVFLVSAVVICTWFPFFIHYGTQWCIVWLAEDLYLDYPHQVMVYNEYTWFAYYKISLYIFMVMLFIVILVTPGLRIIKYLYISLWLCYLL